MKDKYPQAWADFDMWYIKSIFYQYFSSRWNFSKMPFELQLGVYLKYLDDKGIEYYVEKQEMGIKGADHSYELIEGYNHKQKAIEQAFKIREEQLKQTANV